MALETFDLARNGKDFAIYTKPLTLNIAPSRFFGVSQEGPGNQKVDNSTAPMKTYLAVP